MQELKSKSKSGDNLEGWIVWEVGGRLKRERDTYIPMADSC